MSFRVSFCALMMAACAEGPPPATPAAGEPARAVAAGAPAGSASSAPDTPTDFIAHHRASFDACYALARAASPNLGRTSIEMAFAIDAEGKPLTVDFVYRNRMDDKAKECMRDAALALRFPPAMQGKQTAVLVLAPQQP